MKTGRAENGSPFFWHKALMIMLSVFMGIFIRISPKKIAKFI